MSRATPPPAQSARRNRSIECLVFLAIVIAAMSLNPLGGDPHALGFQRVAFAVITYDVALTALALYLVWRSGEGAAAIGWRSAHVGREVLLGIALFIPFVLGLALIESVLRAAGLPPPPGPPPFLVPRSGADYLVALALLFVVAVAEETVFRGYLLLRLRQITGSRAAAIALSSVLFAFGHAYQGWTGVIAVGVIGVAFALIYFWRGNLIAPAVLHFIQNSVGLLLAPKLLEM